MNAEPSAPDPSSLADQVKGFASRNLIDGVGNLTAMNVFLYSGKADSVVKTPVVQAAEQLYRAFVTEVGSRAPPAARRA